MVQFKQLVELVERVALMQVGGQHHRAGKMVQVDKLLYYQIRGIKYV